jgi:protein-L-isoaspartate(D-aspartate) O-methyltransferase
MAAHLRQSGMFNRVLEVGTGCGYQAAVLARLYRQVYSIERVRPLYDTARERIADLGIRNVHLLYGDGMLGWKSQAPFDAIVVAAAGVAIPHTLLEQLHIGGRLIAPEGQSQQRLVLIVREDAQRWVRQELEAVRFVPLKPGVQT